MNVREQGNQLLVTVFVPQGKLTHFEKLIEAYAEHRTGAGGRLLDKQSLIDAILSVRVATFDSLWPAAPRRCRPTTPRQSGGKRGFPPATTGRRSLRTSAR